MIKLEKFDTTDYDRLISWVDSEKLLFIFSAKIFNYPLTHLQLDEYINNPSRIIYKVIELNTNLVIGHAELNNINLIDKNARICRVLIGDANYRNKGFGSQIINELIKIAFKKMDIHRLDLGVFDFNKNAIKCYEKCGFEIEGSLKENIKIGHEYWSTYNMSILNNKKSC